MADTVAHNNFKLIFLTEFVCVIYDSKVTNFVPYRLIDNKSAPV